MFYLYSPSRDVTYYNELLNDDGQWSIMTFSGEEKHDCYRTLAQANAVKNRWPAYKFEVRFIPRLSIAS